MHSSVSYFFAVNHYMVDLYIVSFFPIGAVFAKIYYRQSVYAHNQTVFLSNIFFGFWLLPRLLVAAVARIRLLFD